MQQLTILSDVEEFLPPLSPEEFEGLKADILANGCNDALVVWNDTIIDGHHRYAICTENNIPFKTREMTFESIDDAKMWILANQSSRRNMTAYARTVIALKMKPAFEEKAKRRQSAAGGDHGNQYSVPQWEPSLTLNQISCVDPDPLVGAIFELFPEEYRSKFFSAFFDRFLYWQGKEETKNLFIQLAQTLSNSTNEEGYREKT